METNEKKELTPEERQRRREARKKREAELKKKKQKRFMIIAGLVLAAAALIGLVLFVISRLVNSGPAEISAQGSNFVIAIDPGHGGADTGMNNGETVEKNVTQDICSKLKIMLESQGYTVVMTREEDVRLSKEERVSAVNGSKADLLVSVHCCYNEEDSSVSGVISHYKNDSKESKYLAENIQAAILKENGAEDGGTKQGNYTIISETEVPSVLVEVGYLSNTQEATALAEDSYQNDTAKGIAKGIILSLNRE